MKLTLNCLLIVLLAASGCRKSHVPSGTTSPDTAMKGSVIADTITYQVLISNPDPEDAWTAKCLSGLHRDALIDSIFNMVYSGKASAYNYETHEKMTVRQVKDLEQQTGFSRDNIGKIQFTETWYLDPGSRTMTKKVLAMVLGYNFYTSDGELFGQKSLFRIEMR